MQVLLLDCGYVCLCFFYRFKNRPHLTFDEARGKADQEFDLVEDFNGEIEYPTK